MLKAALIFKGIMIEWVTVKGFDESFEDVDDLWSASRHNVFRKVQDHTHSAMLHFYSPTLPELAVRSFMVNRLLFMKFKEDTNSNQFFSTGMVPQLPQSLLRSVQELRQPLAELVPADVEGLTVAGAAARGMQMKLSSTEGGRQIK